MLDRLHHIVDPVREVGVLLLRVLLSGQGHLRTEE